MKILVLTSTYSRWKDDSEPKFVDNLCHYLAVENEVHVVAPHSRGIPKEEILEGIPVFRFKYCFENWQTLAYDGGILPSLKQNRWRILLVPLFLLSQLLLTLALLRKHHYDVVHAHWIIPQGLVAVLARFLSRGRPALVITSHGGDLFALRGSLLSRLKKFVVGRADALTVVSSAMKGKALDMALADERDVSIIPMGIDSSALFTPPAQPIERKGLLFVGRLVDKKGIEYLLRAMPQVLARHPDEQLTVVGDGPLRHSLIALCESLGIAGRVNFTGSLTNREVPRYLQAAAIAIFPSVVTGSGDQEGSPVAIVEALACGCTVIAADYPGVTDIIEDGETGLIVAGRSPDSIAHAILFLLDNGHVRSRLGENGRRRAQTHYDWETISNRFLGLFRRLCEGRDR